MTEEVKEKKKSNKVIIIAVVAVVVLIVILLAVCFFSLKFEEVEKKDVYEVNFQGEKVDEAKLNCTFFGGKVNDIKANKKVDQNVLGDVEVTYTCSKLFFSKSLKIKYSVVDKDAPEIELKGKQINVVYTGGKYTEAGYRAKDNADGVVTDKVEVKDNTDYSKVGTYYIDYSVKDNAGNVGTTKREILVRKKAASTMDCGKEGVIYLTFDDGPSSATTPKILDVLKKYNVKATFFVIGKGPDELIKREFDEGHAIGLHSNSHDYATIYKSSNAFWSDMNKVASRVEKITGKKTDLLRFPGGSSNTVSKHYKIGIMEQLSVEVEENGYGYFDWNIVSGDAGDLTAETFEGKVKQEYDFVVDNLSKLRGNVVLMHDIKETTAEVLEDIIKYAQEEGYTFDVLSRDIICHQRIWN